MGILVGIPWRPGSPERVRNHRTVVAHMKAALPEADVESFDTDHVIFNRAAARNAAARFALEYGYDVLVLCDADTLVELDPLGAAVQGCGDGRVHLPYTYFRGLTNRGTRMFYAGRGVHDCPAEHEHQWATGGVMVCQPATWFRAGGMDERFRGWGFEDTAARICWDALLGDTVRHEGTINHLWHPLETALGSRHWWHNRRLMDRYEQAEGDRARLVEIIAERAGGDRIPEIPSNTP